jgi:hypothetical protein
MTEKPNPKAIGEISEGIVLAELLKRQVPVLLPFGNNQRYDLVAEEDGTFVRIQVKTAWWVNGCIAFKTNSVNAFTGRRRTYEGQADVFMVYSAHTSKVYRVPVSDCGTSETRLRIEASRGGATSRIRWAGSYELPPVVAPEGFEPSTSGL